MKVSLALLTGMVCLELALRATGFLLALPQTDRNQVKPEDEHLIRILTLGESTTSDYAVAGKGASWPRQLEVELNAEGIPSRVYNEGLVGTQTSLILSHLSEYLDKYRPQIVITMMGTNDPTGMTYGSTLFSEAARWLYNFRIAKLSRWVWTTAKYRVLSCEMGKRSYTVVPALVDIGFKAASTMPLQDVERKLRTFTALDEDVALALTGIGIRMRGDFSEINRVSNLYTDRAWDLAPHNHWVTYSALNVTVSCDSGGIA